MYVPLPLQQLLPPIVTMRYEEKRINLINRHKSKLLLLRKIILQFAKEKEEMRRWRNSHINISSPSQPCIIHNTIKPKFSQIVK